MSDEIKKAYDSNQTNIYSIVFKFDDGSSTVWDTTISAFVSFASADAANYGVDMTENGNGLYTANFPSAILTADTYTYVVYAGPKSDSATVIQPATDIVWNGSSEIAGSPDSGQLTTLANFKEYCGS